MRIGFDIDGVLARFNESFANRLVDTSKRDLLPYPLEFPVWAWPGHFGYTIYEEGQAWDSVIGDRLFWASLDSYPWAGEVLSKLNPEVDDIYFITSRPGVVAKQQTESWLWRNQGPITPTVLISGMKGWVCRSLELDAYIDDRDLNVIDVRTVSPKTQVFLLDQPWNRSESLNEFKGITRITNPLEMLEAIGR